MKKNKISRYIDSLRGIENKTVIITGANSGLGFEMAKVALLKGAKVIMACRNLERAESAKTKLIDETGSQNIVIELYDQSDVKSIQHFAKLIKDKYSDFYALILNAGIFLPNDIIDEYHVSTVYRTNFIGIYILLKYLSDFLDNVDEEKRIVIQGSMSSYFYKYKNKDKFIFGEDKPLKQYSLSKLCCTNLFAHYRDNNLNHHVKYLLCEPGIATTDIYRNFKKWFKIISRPFFVIFTNSALEGSLSGCKLMCDAAANGDYYRPRHLFAAKGLPKKSQLPTKLINEDIIRDAKEMADMYESK